MKKTSPVLIILLMFLIGFALGFLGARLKYGKGIEEKITTTIETKYGVDVYLFDNKLLEEGDNLIITDTLIPIIKIKNIEKINHFKKISIDDGSNILTDKSSQIELKETQNGLLIQTQYAFSPGKHNIDITTFTEDKETLQSFPFVLLIRDNFNLPLNKSKLWVIPESTKTAYQKSWYVEDNLLKIDSLPSGPLASLAFLYTFNKDVTIDFFLKPSSEVINLLVYFLESGKSIIIGNGNNYAHWIIYDDNKAERGENLLIEPGHQYRVRIVRNNFIYKLFIKKVTDEKSNSIKEVFSEANLILTFNDENPSLKNDHIGFTIWGGSRGVEISNIVITGYAIY